MSLINLAEIVEHAASTITATLIVDCPTCCEPKPAFGMCSDSSCHSADIAAAVALDRWCES
jgi:hypothetical protein